MIIYKLTNGFAHDLRYEESNYVLQIGEIKFSSGFEKLPSLDNLHNPLAVQAKLDAEEAERTRLQSFKGDVLATELLEQLRSATPTQINNFVDNQVTDLTSAKTMFKRILLVLALIANSV